MIVTVIYRENMKTKDNCFSCMCTLVISNVLRAWRIVIPLAYTFNSNDFFLLLPLPCSRAHTHTQTFDRYSITSCICVYIQPCAHCCNFLLTKAYLLICRATAAAAIVYFSREMKEIEARITETSDG